MSQLVSLPRAAYRFPAHHFSYLAYGGGHNYRPRPAMPKCSLHATGHTSRKNLMNLNTDLPFLPWLQGPPHSHFLSDPTFAGFITHDSWGRECPFCPTTARIQSVNQALEMLPPTTDAESGRLQNQLAD